MGYRHPELLDWHNGVGEGVKNGEMKRSQQGPLESQGLIRLQFPAELTVAVVADLIVELSEVVISGNLN